MNDKDALRKVIEMVVADKFSDEVQEILHALPDHTEEAAAAFCDRFELGNWLYEAITLKDVDILDWLSDIANIKLLEEEEAAEDRAEIERDYRAMQGWPA